MGQRIETCEEEIMKEVARELGLSYRLVKDMVVNGQFGYVAHLMRSNTFDGVHLPYLGKFKVKPKRIQVTSYKRGMNAVQKDLFVKAVERGVWSPDSKKD